jgi:SAM-dependent methyltransferase
MMTLQRIGKAIGKHATRAALRVRHAAGAARGRWCPACGRPVAGFFRYGAERAWGCPLCGASPRERLMHVLFETGRIVVPTDGAVLHVAPNEHRLVERLRAAAGDYVPADLDPARYTVPGMRAIDLMTLDDPRRYDIVYASHVMEHVPDDARVLRNIAAALRPGGEAWLIVPLWDRPSEDGPADLSGRERERRFGQWDHVRQYGRDFADRIAAAGFDVETIDAARDVPAAEVARMALGDVLFRARRRD